MPLRVRELPELPRRIPRAGVNLEEGSFHKIIVAFSQLQRVPHLVLLGSAALLDAGLGLWLGVWPAAALAVAQLCDWLILMALPRQRISFGPVQPQWLTLVALRVVAALGVGALFALLGADAAPLQIVMQALGVLLVFHGYYREPSRLTLSHVELAVPAFARGTRVKVLHVADVHTERRGRREQQLLQMARAHAPDLIVFSGDFLNLSNGHDPVAQAQARELWRELAAIAPVCAVTGSPPVDSQETVGKILSGLSVRWLRDELHCLCLQGNHVHVVGLTCTHDPRVDGETLRRVLAAGTPPNAANERGDAPAFTLLLYHAPDLAPQAAALGTIDMHCAGHTHGGQVRLPFIGPLMTGSLYKRQLVTGLYQLQSMLLYVSRGVGLEGMAAPRVRFRCPPELMLLTLHGEA